MPAGRPPKPTERKRRAGNPGKHPLPVQKGTLEAASGVPTPPVALQTTGLTAWNMLWEAAKVWLSPKTDLALMARLCQSYDRAALYNEILEHDGWVIEEPNAAGNATKIVVHPVAKELRGLERDILAMEGRAGFTPSDRVRLGIEVAKNETATSKLDQLREKRRQSRQA
jgi:P27 family predicted phage terminase small subunit